MKQKTIIAAAFVLTTLYAFTPAPETKVSGTYGVCKTSEVTVQLVLNEDHSFNYIDKSDRENPVYAEGTWEADGKKIKLNDSSHNLKRTAWRVEKGSRAVKSRVGLSFYRLGNQKLCD
ncbi:MAG: hypothetical protein WEC59_02995 [Salibacteraceae bacterium]